MSAWQRNNANRVLEIRHIAGLVCKTLDLGLTPTCIKAGFAATGIVPYDPNIFHDAEFVAQMEDNTTQTSEEENLDIEDQRLIIITDVLSNVGREEEVTTSATSAPENFANPMAPETSANLGNSMESDSNLSADLETIGPLQTSTPKKKSNRGRKPMESTELTSSANITLMKEKQAKKLEKKNKNKPNPTKENNQSPAKRPKKTRETATARTKKADVPLPDDEDLDFCIICYKNLPLKLTNKNAIMCSSCERPVHRRCVNQNTNVFTCKLC